jgi:hypothetical protein
MRQCTRKLKKRREEIHAQKCAGNETKANPESIGLNAQKFEGDDRTLGYMANGFLGTVIKLAMPRKVGLNETLVTGF